MRKRLLLIALVILTLGVIGTGLSTLYERNEWITSQDQGLATFKLSYGFPMGWHGYSQSYSLYVPPLIYPPKTYWFSLGSLLLDAAFWFAISFFMCVVAVKLESILRKTAASKIVFVNMVLAYFFSSLTFMVGGILFSVTQNFEGARASRIYALVSYSFHSFPCQICSMLSTVMSHRRCA